MRIIPRYGMMPYDNQIHCGVARWKARHQSYLFIPSKASNKPLIGRYNRKLTQRSGEKLRQPSKNSDKTNKPFSNEKKAFGEESNTNRKRLDKIGRNKEQQTKDVATETMPPPRRSVGRSCLQQQKKNNRS